MKWYKSKLFIIATSFLCLILLVGVPMGINELYKINDGYITLWGANDVLTYYGCVLSALGTIFIGIIAINQSKQANEISDRLLKIEEINPIPFLHISMKESSIISFTDKCVSLFIGVQNDTSGVINIENVSSLTINSITDTTKDITFDKTFIKHNSILPNQTKQLMFESKINNGTDSLFHAHEYQHQCSFEIKIRHVNSDIKYIQKIEFILYIYEVDENLNYKFVFQTIGNSITQDGT